MEFKKITAIIPCYKLECVAQRLKSMGVKGMSITHVMGYGEYANLFRADGLCRHSRIEIFVMEEEVDEIVDTIIQTVHTGTTGDGIIAILPVDAIYKIRTKHVATIEEI